MENVPETLRTGTAALADDDSQAENAFLVKVAATLEVLMEDAVTIAKTYASKAGRSDPLPEDCAYALKHCTRTFFHGEGLEERYQRAFESMQIAIAQEMMEAAGIDDDSDVEDGSDDSDVEEGSDESAVEETDSNDDEAVVEATDSNDEDLCEVGSDRDEPVSEPHDPPAFADEDDDEDRAAKRPRLDITDAFCRADESDPWVRDVHASVDTWAEWAPEDELELMLKHSVIRTIAHMYEVVSSACA